MSLLTLHVFYSPACCFQSRDKYRLCCCSQYYTFLACHSDSFPASAFVDLRRSYIWYSFSVHSQRTSHDMNCRSPCNERRFSPDPRARCCTDYIWWAWCKRVSRSDEDAKNILDDQLTDLVG